MKRKKGRKGKKENTSFKNPLRRKESENQHCAAHGGQLVSARVPGGPSPWPGAWETDCVTGPQDFLRVFLSRRETKRVLHSLQRVRLALSEWDLEPTVRYHAVGQTRASR